MVPYSAVVVWELRGLIEDVHCFFVRRGPAYILSIERAGERLLEELHEDFREMISRARELRSSLVRVGFEPVSADATTTAPVDSLLLNFVRVGSAPAAALGHRPS
jgi:uncharacterized membrane protein